MKLSELLRGAAQLPEGIKDIQITKISSDTRDEIDSGTLFVCLKGAKFDAHDAVPELEKKGVGAVVTERDCAVGNQIIVPDTRLALSRIWANMYSNPEKKMKFIGVTGTNGKTTTTTLIKRLLDDLNIPAGLIGTCQNEICGEVTHAERTTPEPNEFFELLDRMAESGCRYVVMEVSSQGLEQQRLGDVWFKTAVFTNLTQDHLDVHGTMENYYQAKKLLFSRCTNALVNIDDEYGARLYGEISCNKFSFSEKNSDADFSADFIKLHGGGSSYWLSDRKKTYKVDIRLPGSYNVSNSMAAICALELCGIGMDKTAAGIAKIPGVRGRCELVDTGRDFSVILDYAHTPDALVNILETVREFAKGRVVCLFGCGGNRDAKKRPLMAKAAAENADFLIITSDNPRDEDPHEIITQIIKGLDADFKEYIEIDNRRDAIFWAVKNAQKDDVIVLAGKGHEDYQILAGGVKIHFDEREVVKDALAAAFADEGK